MINPGRILLVEDDPKDVERTLTALDEFNLANEVHVAGDGAEALDYLCCTGKYQERARGLPAVMLLDLKLPKLDGLEVLKRIKDDEAMRTIPIVALTSSREERAIINEAPPGSVGKKGKLVSGQ
jgi:CheY-like chemotaxis protein